MDPRSKYYIASKMSSKRHCAKKLFTSFIKVLEANLFQFRSRTAATLQLNILVPLIAVQYGIIG